LDEVEKRLLGPVQVVPDDDQRTLLRRLLEQAPDGERDLLLGGRSFAAEQRVERTRDSFLELALLRPELLHDLDERPVRNALAVRQAASPNDGRIDTPQELGRQARL